MKATDPVCGMSIESEKAHASETYEGRTYYFCSAQCQRSFKADPKKFAAKAGGDAGHGGLLGGMGSGMTGGGRMEAIPWRRWIRSSSRNSCSAAWT